MRTSYYAFQLLTEWISFLLAGLPAKPKPTMLELLFDIMISRTGHIADALLSIKSKRTWITYFKAIQKGRFSWLKLAQRWVQLLLKLFGNLLTLVLDDFIAVHQKTMADPENTEKSSPCQKSWALFRASKSH